MKVDLIRLIIRYGMWVQDYSWLMSPLAGVHPGPTIVTSGHYYSAWQQNATRFGSVTPSTELDGMHTLYFRDIELLSIKL